MAQTFPIPVLRLKQKENTHLSSGSTVGLSEGKAGVVAFPKFFTRLGSEKKSFVNLNKSWIRDTLDSDLYPGGGGGGRGLSQKKREKTVEKPKKQSQI